MGLLAEYHLAYRHLPLVDVAAAVPTVTLSLEVGQPNQGGPPPFVVRAASPDERFDDLECALEESAFVRAYSRVGESADRRLYQLVPAASMDDQLGSRVDDPDTLRTLSGNESIVERITVTPEGWIQVRWFADRDAFDEYCSFWRENATSFSLVRLSSTDAGSDAGHGPISGPASVGSRSTLTDRQREAIVTAREMGYFEIPRGATLEDVATELGITAPSLSERLRRANARLVEDVVASGPETTPHVG